MQASQFKSLVIPLLVGIAVFLVAFVSIAILGDAREPWLRSTIFALVAIFLTRLIVRRATKE